MKLALTPHVKILRNIEFSTRRIREVRTLAYNNQELIPATLERYAATLNTLLDRRVIDEDLSLIIGGILGFLEVFGKEYITPILLIGLAVIILCIVVYYAIRFLEAREKRWQGNKEVHQKLT